MQSYDLISYYSLMSMLDTGADKHSNHFLLLSKNVFLKNVGYFMLAKKPRPADNLRKYKKKKNSEEESHLVIQI